MCRIFTGNWVAFPEHFLQLLRNKLEKKRRDFSVSFRIGFPGRNFPAAFRFNFPITSLFEKSVLQMPVAEDRGKPTMKERYPTDRFGVLAATATVNGKTEKNRTFPCGSVNQSSIISLYFSAMSLPETSSPRPDSRVTTCSVWSCRWSKFFP